MYDHHCVVSATDLAVGGIVQLGISHPCSAFARWDTYLVTRGDGVAMPGPRSSGEDACVRQDRADVSRQPFCIGQAEDDTLQDEAVQQRHDDPGAAFGVQIQRNGAQSLATPRASAIC